MAPAPCKSPSQSDEEGEGEGAGEGGSRRGRKRGKHKPPENKGQHPGNSASTETKEIVAAGEQRPDRRKRLTSSGGLGVF